MTPNSDTPKEQNPPQEPRKPVTLDEFNATDFEAALKDSAKVDARDLSSQFLALAREAEEREERDRARVFGLLSQVCGIHLRAEDRADPWGPLVSGPGWRLAIPADFKGEQSAAFLAILDRIKNPGLRGRLADVAWSNDRKAAASAAATAVAAYQECADGLLAGKFKPYPSENRASIETLKNVQRAFAITQVTTKKDAKGRAQISDGLKTTALTLYSAAKEDHKFVVFQGTAELVLHYGLLERAIVAKDAEELATTETEHFTLAIKGLWDLAASLYRTLGNKEGEQRCRFASVQQTLTMRKQVNSPGAEAYWVQCALLELRHIEGQDKLEDNLLLELRRLQRASTKQMATFSLPLDVEELREAVEKTFENLTLAEAMRQFGCLARSASVKDLRQKALDGLRDHPLPGITPMAYIDQDGKPIAHSPGADMNGEHSGDWYRSQILANEEFRRQYVIAGRIEPARLTIQSRFLIEQRHLEPIVLRSPFVPPSQAPIIVLGLARYFQGDFMSATHLLIVQLEACLRHLLKLNGHDPVRRFDDGTEEDLRPQRHVCSNATGFGAHLRRGLGL